MAVRHAKRDDLRQQVDVVRRVEAECTHVEVAEEVQEENEAWSLGPPVRHVDVITFVCRVQRRHPGAIIGGEIVVCEDAPVLRQEVCGCSGRRSGIKGVARRT